MQSPTADPRDGMAEADVVALIESAEAVTIGQGCELVDRDLNVIEDITEDMAVGGSVTRSNYATLHGSAQLEFRRALDWGQAIVRPYMTLSDGTTTARFNLGAYFTDVPKETIGETDTIFPVDAVDQLDPLADAVGDAYGVDAGDNVIDTVLGILSNRGYSQWVLDASRADATLPSSKAWALDSSITWLTVVNELLGSIGYQGIWADWSGRLRLQTYLRPIERNPEWIYRSSGPASMLYPVRERELDLFGAPNRWVFYRGNQTEDETPLAEGAGIFTYENAVEGPTSIEARGRTITAAPESLDAVDQDALVQQAMSKIDAAMNSKAAWTGTTFPNPLTWHFDRYLYYDSTRIAPIDVLSTQWTINLDGSPMQHTWSEV
jgi:hypothetical protein